MLLRGSFPPRKRLEEIDLSRRLGVSRPVLRLTLEQLASEGLLEPALDGGYAARHFTLEDIRDAILARSTLEGMAASLAAKRIQDPAELESARKVNAQLGRAIASPSPSPPTAEEMSRFGDLNAEFHSALVAMARSPMLSWSLQRLQSAAFASPAAVVIPAEGDGVRRAFEEHEAILNAIEARDASRADALVRQHADLAIHGIESALKGQPHSSRNIALALVGKKPFTVKANKPGRPPKKKEAASGNTSTRILDAAADLFCEKGFYATTTRELATRLNIQQASLYHHINNKEELLHRICRQVMDCFLADLPVALNKAKTGRGRMSAFIEAHLEVMAQNPRHTLAMVTEFRALSRLHFAEISENYKEYSRLLDAEMNAARGTGLLRTDISSKYVRLALLNVLNWTPRWFHPSGALSCKDLSSLYAGIFWEGVISSKLGHTPSLPPLPASANRQRSRGLHRGTLGKFIRAAAELFSKYGYESTSTRDLATLLGMEKATLYYHVEGKQDLLYAICKSSIEQLSSDVTEAIDGISDPLAQLQVWIQAHVVSLLRDQTQHATSLAEARALSPDRLAEIVSMRKAYQARTRSLIEAGQRAGYLRTDIASRYLGQTLEGLLDRTVVWYKRSGALSPSELGATLCSIFIGGAQHRSAPRKQ
ncbi:MAG TPA: TetR family transcriptional regulator [Bryobacteraceae bacterium]|jgi:GntR family transcriptional regulator of vanillate catabolism